MFVDYYSHGPRVSEVPEAMLVRCIVMYSFTNLHKTRYLSHQTAAAKQALAEERA